MLIVLREVHDDEGHWGKTATLARLRGLAYWPEQTVDVERYIAGCTDCARYGPATRSQPLHPIMVLKPFQLLGMDWIGPLPTTSSGNRFIFNVLCYFLRFSITFASPTDDVEDVIMSLEEVFTRFTKPAATYMDSGQHFNNQELRHYHRGLGVSVDYSPSGLHKSTGMIEGSNRILESVLAKTVGSGTRPFRGLRRSLIVASLDT